MVSYAEAINKIKLVAGMHSFEQTEEVSMVNGVGRLLAEDIYSTENVPSFHNSAMDGFVLCAEDTLTASPEQPLEFVVYGEIAAGDWLTPESLELCALQGCYEIMTGAPIPHPIYDAVIKVEEVEKFKDSQGQFKIRLSRPVKVGENVRPAGSDIQAGQLLFAQGQRFTSEMILGAAACGVTNLKVTKRPRVAILSTGSELVDFNSKRLIDGKIRNSTGPFLESKLVGMGVDVENYGLVPDNPQGYTEVFKKVLASGVDLILTTGAVSMGKYDFIIPVLKDFGSTVHFHKVAIRPGKPIVFAEIPVPGSSKKIPLFGMPGNPVSTAVALQFFVQPYLNAALGLVETKEKLAKVVETSRKPEGLRCFYKAIVTNEDGEEKVQILTQQASYMVGNFAEVNSWVVLPEENPSVQSGATVEFVPLNERGL